MTGSSRNRRIGKLEAAAAEQGHIDDRPDKIEIEFVDMDGSVTDRVIIPVINAPQKSIQLK